jgi:hypothetical protein
MKEDVLSTSSDKTGIAGFFETLLRRFRNTSYIVALTPLYIIGIFAMGVSALPGVYLFNSIYDITIHLSEFYRYLFLAIGLIASYFAYGITLIFIMPAVNFMIPLKLKPFRGQYYSLRSVPWFIHNALTYVVRYTFLEFVTPTPVNILFYKMMGMKIGKGVHLNTTNISDPALIELEDYVTVGGSAHIIAHYASKGYVIVEPVKIKKGVTIGLKATIMGDVEIGENAVIAPHEVVFPKSRIPANRKPGDASNSKNHD